MIHQSDSYSLLHHNTFRINASCARFIEYDTLEDLRGLIHSGSIVAPYLHIGQGSNLLFVGDYPGIILHSLIRGIEVVTETADEVLLKVGSGVVWDDFVAHCVRNNLYGAENLSNIPGEVGASAVQNIGAYGAEVKDIIHTVETINLSGDEHIYKVEDCHFSYRHSLFKEPQMKDVFVTSVTFRLSKHEKYNLFYGSIQKELARYPSINLANVRQAIIDIRSSKLPDPSVQGNAGSFFMNPVVVRSKFEELKAAYPEMPFYDLGEAGVKIPAGWLIEQSGWKGKSLGAAKVHDKQALVLVNAGGVTGSDIVALSDAIQATVGERFGIRLKPEVKFVS